jgi:YegS/Rv2252/BmrU family lipid kinase
VRVLREHGLAVRREDTRDLEHARELARAAAQAGEIAVALGGDGLAGAVADALREIPGATLGVLPGGRGNDLARVLGIPRDPLAACAVIATGASRPLDLGEVDGRAFVGIASAGFDSEANRIANEAPARLGNLVYAYGALRALASWRPAHFEIELDPPGERIAFEGYTVAVANSRNYGGGMQIAPDALLDDGLLDIVLIERVSRWRCVANMPKLFKGTHTQLPEVRVLRAREVAISAERPFALYADGDPIAQLPVRVRALPGTLNVLLPAGGVVPAAFSGAAVAGAGDAGSR